MLKIFIPVYNEEDHIKKNLSYIYSTFRDLLKIKFKIYIVNDGSTDNTTEIIDSFKCDNIIHLRLKGPTVRENLAKSFIDYGEKGDLLFFMDSDLSTEMRAILKLIHEIERGYDVVIGSRYVKGSKLKRTPYRFVVSKIFNMILRVLFCSKIKDHECGFKIFRAEVLKDIAGDMGWNLDRRAFWDSEFLIRAQKKNFKIKEIPVNWVEGPKSYISISKEKSMIPYIIRLKFRMIRENINSK